MADALRMIARGLMISLFVPAVSAATIEMTFTATNFAPLFGAVPPIDDPVSGTIRYEAASINAPIDALTSVSLVIAGHMYTLAEIGFDNETGVNYIGGLVDGVLGSGNFEDDFQIGWDTGSLVPLTPLPACGYVRVFAVRRRRGAGACDDATPCPRAVRVHIRRRSATAQPVFHAT